MGKIAFKVVSSVVIIGALLFVVFWFNQHGAVDNYRNIEYIQAHMYNGKIIDLQNEISIRSVDDVKWYYDDHDTIVIEYGKVLLKYKLSDFVTKDVQDELNSILITTKQHPETLEFTLYFDGQEMTEYVKK